MMTLSTAASVALYCVLIFVLVFAIITVVLLFAIALGLRGLNSKLNEAMTKVDPVLTQTTQTLDTVQRVTSEIGEKANDILARGETMTDDVARKVENTASVMQRAVTTPLINISSVVAGVSETLSSLGRNFGKVRDTMNKGNTSNGHK